MMDARLLEAGSIYAADSLVEAFKVARNNRPWHDKPEGEYLVLNRIPSTTFMGSIAYEAMHAQIETLMPELVDKPHQLLAELRKYYHGAQEEIVRAARGGRGWPVRSEEYGTACRICEGFGFVVESAGYRHGLLLTLMILSFRCREAETIPWATISKNFVGMYHRLAYITYNTD